MVFSYSLIDYEWGKIISTFDCDRKENEESVYAKKVLFEMLR